MYTVEESFTSTTDRESGYYLLLTFEYCVLRVGPRVFFFERNKLKQGTDINNREYFSVGQRDVKQIPLESMVIWPEAQEHLRISLVHQQDFKYYD